MGRAVTLVSSTQRIGAWVPVDNVTVSRSLAAARKPLMNRRIHAMAVSIIAGVAAVVSSPVGRAEDVVTYEVFSAVVPMVASIEYRDVSGKKLLQSVPLPWQTTVPVVNIFSPEDAGAEVRTDWRPPFRTAATVGRVLQGQLVTVRITFRGHVVCESTLDVGNVTCYGSVQHRSETDSSYDRSPVFPEPASGLSPP
jgi:hypothetical protein